MELINKLLNEILNNNTLVKIIFSGLRKKSLPYQKVSIRPIILQGNLNYQVEYHYEKKVTHENIDKEEFLDLCNELIIGSFKQTNIFCIDTDYQILAAKPDKPKIIKNLPTKKIESFEHNQSKKYIIPDGKPCDFLVKLGVMAENGQVIKKYYAKFRQINKFLEIISDVLDYIPKCKNTIRIIDFGCGKAYLTFALYYFLKIQLNKNIEIIGLDLKKEVIDFCNSVAKDLNYNDLHFLMGDIADYDEKDSVDMVVTLHACDTATDYALIKAVRWNASVILSVPCCQHELFSQITNKLHQPILKHGILNERFCAILTDGLRSLKLEEQGYDVALVEFTSLEHTAKNIMIRAVKTRRKNKAAGDEYQRLIEFWNVSPTIDKLI